MLTLTNPKTASIRDTPLGNRSEPASVCNLLHTAVPYQNQTGRSDRSAGLFIKGPIPFSWLQKANQLGGSTGAVATALWFYVGIHKSRRFRIDQRLDQLCGLTRQTRSAVLARLQAHGLIVVHPKRGAYPTIEVLDAC